MKTFLIILVVLALIASVYVYLIKKGKIKDDDQDYIPDVVEDGITGFLVPVKDAKSLAEKIEILIKDPELRMKMGKAGRKKYEEEFTLEKFENRIVEILNDVAEK